MIAYIHAHPFPPDTITVPAGTYTLTQGELLITDSLNITGTSTRGTVIQEPAVANRATMGDRVFEIGSIPGGPTPTVSISGVEISGGDANASNAYGGGDILNAGTLTLADDWITNGYACSGGGVFNRAGTLTIERSLVSGNHASCAGGGGGDSGGVGNYGSPASSGMPDIPGHLVIDDSTITGNDARLGGGVFTWNDAINTLSITNSTIAFNHEQDEPDGAVRADPGHGGGLGFQSGVARIQNSIFAGNTSTATGALTTSNCGSVPSIASLGHNLDSSNDCGFTAAGDLHNANPLLGPLQNNGGPTDTLAIPSSSPAVDRVPGSGAGCPATDQRGVTRPQGSGCDIGAFELQVPPRCTGGSATTAAGGSTVTVSLPCTESAAGPLTLAVTSAPAHGTLGPIDQAGQAVAFTPTPGYFGTDTFSYTGTDSGGISNVATVTITVPPPPPPACGGIAAETAPGGSVVTITFACSAPASAGAISYAVVTGPAHGKLTAVNPLTGTVQYRPAAGFFGRDAFTYTGAAGGQVSSPAAVSVTVPPPQRLTATMSWGFGLFRGYNTVV